MFSQYWPLHTNPVAPLSLEGFGVNSNNSTKRLPGFKCSSENWRAGKTENAFDSTVENKRGHKQGRTQRRLDDCEATGPVVTYLIHHQFTVQLIWLFASVGFDAPNKVRTGSKHLLHKDSQGMLYGTKRF